MRSVAVPERSVTALGVEPAVVWLVSSDDVHTIWRSTREVFGNKLWHSDVDEVLDVEAYEQYVHLVEERSGQSLFACVMDAVLGLYPADPSEVFAALHDGFVEYGVDLRFADHYRYGDLLARAAALASGEPVAEPSHVHEMDADAVVGIWDDAIAQGWQDFRPDEWYDDDLRDDLSGLVDGELFLLTAELVDGLDEDSDPSLFFRNLRQYGADNGITITFAHHPEFGDVLARAATMSG